ncbi:RHS repeat-associated core domain-containing protein [Pseudomonas fulva]|uniref:RHS repeat-associated core domain-containing protein n=1 Tax=Pseudomonas fulva TaxID=47880 RepID=UPI003EF0484F
MKMPISYAPFGSSSLAAAATHAVGFTGQNLDRVLQGYHLGNGTRVYSPCLMRFHSPDALSPFLNGGINTYAYCLNDPVNGQDPTGRAPFFNNVFKAGIQRFQQAYKRLAVPRNDGLLNNSQSRHLGEEMMFAKQSVKAATVEYRVIQSSNGLAQLESSKVHKFVFTAEHKLVAFSAPNDDIMPSHAALGEFSGLGHGTKGLGEKVISAGYIKKDGADLVYLDHYSGHFQPGFEHLYVVQEYLASLGVRSKLIRLGI